MSVGTCPGDRCLVNGAMTLAVNHFVQIRNNYTRCFKVTVPSASGRGVNNLEVLRTELVILKTIQQKLKERAEGTSGFIWRAPQRIAPEIFH